MIGRLLDKLVFAMALILALQVPQLADHYQQFLAGWYESTKWQVDGYEATAKEHGYPSVLAMIEHHRQNPVPSVRKDADQKLSTLDLYWQAKAGMAVFEHGNLIDKAIYMFNPERYRYLEKTVSNFTPGIPLTIGGWTFGIAVGLMINGILMLPIVLFLRCRAFGRSREKMSTDAST